MTLDEDAKQKHGIMEYYDHPKGIPDMRGTLAFTRDRKPLFPVGETTSCVELAQDNALLRETVEGPKMMWDENIARIKELEAWKRKWTETFGLIMAEKCPEDEIHCGCVPFLQVKVGELDTKRDMLKDQVLDLDQIIKKLKQENEKLRLRLVYMDNLWHRHNGHVQYRERCEEMQCRGNAIALFGKPSMSVPERKQYDDDLKQALEEGGQLWQK